MASDLHRFENFRGAGHSVFGESEIQRHQMPGRTLGVAISKAQAGGIFKQRLECVDLRIAMRHEDRFVAHATVLGDHLRKHAAGARGHYVQSGHIAHPGQIYLTANEGGYQRAL
jgi:hypothetical protein